MEASLQDQLTRIRPLRSRRLGQPSLRPVNATELFAGLAGLPGSRDAGAANGVSASRLVNGVEYAHTASVDERKMRAAWKRRRGGGAVPLLLIADDPEDEGRLRVLGPQPEGPVRRIRAESLFDLISRTPGLRKLEAVRQVAQEVERLDTEGVAGLTVRGLGSEHLYAKRLPQSERWKRFKELTQGLPTVGWREVLTGLGYEIASLPKRGYLASSGGEPVIVVHPRQSADQLARFDEAGRSPEGALVTDCLASGAPYGLLAAGTRMRLLRAGRDYAGSTTRYIELDPAAMESEYLPLVGLLAPEFLASGGLEELLIEARDYGSSLSKRLDRSLRQDVMPRLGRELGRWATASGRDVADDEVRAELEAAALTWVFRALFLLYAESAGYLPMSNHTYAGRSFTRIAERAAEEQDVADQNAKTLWRDISGLVEAMRTGQSAWGVPAYNGALFAPDGFDGAEILEVASITDAALAPALVALARDPKDSDVGVDFSDLEIGHLGHIYEGLLSLRLSVADRDFRYDAKSDRYVPASSKEVEIARGDLLWLTNEGGRKGGGVYYTRTELVRHLVHEAVRPAFERHLSEVRELASSDPRAAAHRLFEFFVLDPACGSAHFLVEVVEELADQIATLLGDLGLPAVREELDGLRRAASSTFGAGIEDTALLKRLVLKRCVYGVDLSRMGAEIAKVSLWLGSFVPGLSLAYLDHNVRVGNSLIGVVRPESMTPPGTEHGQAVLFGDALSEAVAAAAEGAARLRAIDDRTPAEVEASRSADSALQDSVAAAEQVLDLWVAQPLGLDGARDEALQAGHEIIAGQASRLGEEATELARSHSALHWPLAFAEVFARERPGFDVVVGNPPWEEIKLEVLAFFGLYRPGLRSMPEARRKEEIERLKTDRPELVERFDAEQKRIAALRGYLGPAGGYEGTTGDPDIYKFFCQRYRDLLRPDGRIGVVLPRTAFQNQGSAGFRRWLFDEAVPTRIDFLQNNRLWAFDTHPQYTVALLAAKRHVPEPDDMLEVAGIAHSVAEFLAQSATPGLRLARRALGPDLEIPLLSSQAAADLLAKLRLGVPFPHGCGRWRCFPVREFDESLDSRLWEGATAGRPLWKGENFDQFDPHGTEARVCPPSEEALAKARKPRPGANSLLADEVPVATRRIAVERTFPAARVAFRLVSRATDSRTVRACLVPPEHFLVNSAPYLAFVDRDPRAEAACLALMNSLVFDWQARRLVEANLNFFILEGLRLPALDDDTFAALAATAAWLSCPDDRFADFAAATEVEVEQLDDDERTRLRAEIDAHVARAWGLTSAELELVFDDFTEDAVTPAYREAVRQRFAA
jgi:Eco57I restriction-modification methylase